MLEKNKFVLLLGIHILIVILVKIIEDSFEIPLTGMQINEYSKVSLFFSAVIFAPLVEEVSYRYPLIKDRFVYASLIFGCVLSYVVDVHLLMIVIMVCLNIITFVMYFFLKKEKLPISISILYVIAFAISHIANYDLLELSELPWFSFIFMFYAQILLGAATTFLRYHYRFRYVILYHSLYNMIIFLFHIFV